MNEIYENLIQFIKSVYEGKTDLEIASHIEDLVKRDTNEPVKWGVDSSYFSKGYADQFYFLNRVIPDHIWKAAEENATKHLVLDKEDLEYSPTRDRALSAPFITELSQPPDILKEDEYWSVILKSPVQS